MPRGRKRIQSTATLEHPPVEQHPEFIQNPKTPQMPEPLFKTGDTAYIIWRNDNPITIRWQGTKWQVFFPQRVLSIKILSNGTYNTKARTYTYQGLNGNRQPQQVYEDGLYATRYAAEKYARTLITDQVVGALKVFFEIASKAGYGSKAAWREIIDSAVIKLYEQIDNMEEQNAKTRTTTEN